MKHTIIQIVITWQVIVSLVVSISVNRKLNVDEFSHGGNITCMDSKESSVIKEGTDDRLCECNNGKHFVNYRDVNCANSEEIIKRERCTTFHETVLEDTMKFQINNCDYPNVVQTEVWNTTDTTSSWNTIERQQIFIPTINQLFMKPKGGNWNGVLLKLVYICHGTHARQCMIVKFTGTRQYPLQQDFLQNPLPETTSNPTLTRNSITVSSISLKPTSHLIATMSKPTTTTVDQSNGNGTSTELIAGVIIASVSTLLIVLAVACVCCRQNRKKKLDEESIQNYNNEISNYETVPSPLKSPTYFELEVENDSEFDDDTSFYSETYVNKPPMPVIKTNTQNDIKSDDDTDIYYSVPPSTNNEMHVPTTEEIYYSIPPVDISNSNITDTHTETEEDIYYSIPPREGSNDNMENNETTQNENEEDIYYSIPPLDEILNNGSYVKESESKNEKSEVIKDIYATVQK